MSLHHTYNHVLSAKWCMLMGILLFCSWLSGHAQVTDSTAVPIDTTSVSNDSTVISNDSTAAQTDSTQIRPDSSAITPAVPDSIPNSASQQASSADSKSLKKGELKFQSTDSLVFNFRNDRIADLYGSAKVNHQSGQLKSGKVQLNLDKNLVHASTQTPQDTLSEPVLTREGQPPVRSKKIAFNYKTEKGRFNVAKVDIDQGKVTGTKVKNVSKNVVFLEDAIYTTSKLEHPSYYIKADKMKLVKKKNGKKEIFFKNARLYILDIPYPIVFPFGYIPGKLSQHQSGVLKPTYVFQNTSSRGLGLRNLGWFQYFNDYLTGQASVDIYTSGTFYFNGGATYRKRNKYNGSVNIGYSMERGLESTDPGFSPRVEKNIQINHSQEFSPYANISANINLSTAKYFKRNSYDIDDRAKTSTNSSINYRYRHPENLYNFTASIRQNQNFLTNTTRLTGPSFDFSLHRLTPFSSDEASSSDESSKWYENLSLQYRNSFDSNFDFDPVRDDSAQVNWFQALLHPSKYRKATNDNDQYKFGFQQDADISVSDLLDSQYLNLSANANYTEYWFPTSIRKTFNPDSNQVETNQVRGFTSARDFSTSLNFSTTIYGISHAKIGNIEGFRHTLRPSISFSYRPDFSSDFFGYYRDVKTDTSGRTRRYSIFENEVFSGPGRGEQRAINFGINNVFEAKQVKRDSTGEKSENIIRLIDQLSLSSSYNFAADSLKLSDLNASLTSSVVDGVNLRASANFNFYDRNQNGTTINKYLLATKGKLAELTNFSFNASTSFSGGKGGGVNVSSNPPSFPAHYDPLNQSLYNQMDPYFNTQPVQPIKSPWSFSINFRYNWTLSPTRHNNTSATINAQNIQFQLTPEWSFSTRLGYDFIQHKLTPSQFSLNRQFDVWTMSFQMNPFGDFQYYFFKLSINSSQIQGIFQKLPLLKNLERSSSPSGHGIGGGRYGGGYGGY